MKNFKTKKSSNKKLNHVKIDSFCVKEVKEFKIYELNLFKEIRIFLVFDILLLKNSRLQYIYIKKIFISNQTTRSYI